MSKIIVLKDAQDLEQKFLELLHLAIKCRKHEKKFKEEFGAINRHKMKEWQERMDAFLAELIVKEEPEHLRENQLEVHFTNHQ